MVAPVNVGNVEDSYVRIAAKKGGQVVQADITQSIQAESDNNLHSPINKEIVDLVANQQRQHLNYYGISPPTAVNHDDDKESGSLAEATSNTNSDEATPHVDGQNDAQESRRLFQSLAPSERRSTALRSRSKIHLMERTRLRPPTKEQQLGLINKLENDISSLSKENMELRRKVTLFQELFRDREKLNKVLKKLEEKE